MTQVQVWRWCFVLLVVGCKDDPKPTPPTSEPPAPTCNQADSAKRRAWLSEPSSDWSADPEHPESQRDHGLRIDLPCYVGLKYRDFSCDADAFRKNVHGFSFFIAERLGFTTVICDEIDGVDTSKRLVHYPIHDAYQQGDFTVFMKEGFDEYANGICKCKSRACAEMYRRAYDSLDRHSPLLAEDHAGPDASNAIEANRKRFQKCESKLLARGRQ